MPLDTTKRTNTEANDGAAPLEPLGISWDEAARLTGLSKNTLRDRAKKKLIDVRKSGARTVLLYASVKEYMSSLPSAV